MNNLPPGGFPPPAPPPGAPTMDPALAYHLAEQHRAQEAQAFLQQQQQEAMGLPPQAPLSSSPLEAALLRQQGHGPPLPPPPPPPRPAPLAPPPRPAPVVPKGQVIEIDDDSDDEDAFVPPGGRNDKKRPRQQQESSPQPSRKKKNSNRTSPHLPAAAAAPPMVQDADNNTSFTGLFVTGVLSGDLLKLERERNRKRALANVLYCATGYTKDTAPPGMQFPPSSITFDLKHAQTLSDGFLDDRNSAVSEAVRIAYAELKGKHEEIMAHAKQQQEQARASKDKKWARAVLIDEIEEMKHGYRAQRQQLLQEIQAMQSAHDKQVKKLETAKKKRDTDNKALKKQATDLEAKLASARELVQNYHQVTSTNTNAEVDVLRKKLQQAEARHARSLNAFVKASVSSLRQFRKRANAVPVEDDDEVLMEEANHDKVHGGNDGKEKGSRDEEPMTSVTPPLDDGDGKAKDARMPVENSQSVSNTPPREQGVGGTASEKEGTAKTPPSDKAGGRGQVEKALSKGGSTAADSSLTKTVSVDGDVKDKQEQATASLCAVPPAVGQHEGAKPVQDKATAKDDTATNATAK